MIVKKCFITLIAVLMLIICVCGCSGGGTAQSGSESISESATSVDTSTNQSDEPNQPKNIFLDPDFKNGFKLLGTNSATQGTTVFKKIRYGSGLGTQRWSLAQWWSKYDLKNGTESATNIAYTLSDESKKVLVDMNSYAVTLEVNASEEFDTWQTGPSAWPHLLLEQAITPVSISEAESVDILLDFTANKAIDKRNGDGKGLHAQFAWFIYIKDTNEESQGYGNFLWFGLNLWNPPMEKSNSYRQQDMAGGPGNFIYSLGADEFMDEPIVTVGEANLVEKDILPNIIDALALAHERGFMIGTEVSDCSITGTNIGWEVFDRWDVSVTINDIGVFVE